MNFQKRLILSFLAIFALFTAGLVAFDHARGKKAKQAALEERLDAYADQALRYNGVWDSLATLFPSQLRLTVLTPHGMVEFDNAVRGTMTNHAERPEVAAAMAHGRGSAIRTSESNDRPYLYYARKGRGRIVRVALPYDVRVRSFLKPDNAFLYFSAALLAAGALFIWLAARRLGRAQQRLQHLEVRDKNRRLKQELTGNIAHELRTPVTSIRGFLEILLSNELPAAKARDYLKRAYNQTLTLSELISDMSLLARLDERRENFALTSVDVGALLARVQADTGFKSFAVDITAGLAVHGNENLLYSIFRNLTDNVVAHAGAGAGITVRAVRVQGAHSEYAPHGMVEFTFADTGVGIADDRHLSKLFERFYRVSEGRTRDTGGSGLGLSIVKNAVLFHGGAIAVHHNTPQGLTFIFTLPAA